MPGRMKGFNKWIGLNTGTGYAFGTYGTVDSLFNVTSGFWTRTVERQDDLDEYTGYEEDTSSGTQRILSSAVNGPMAGRATPHAVAILGIGALGTWSSGTAGTLGTSATAYRHRIRPMKGTAGTQGAGTLPALHVTESLSGASDLQFDYQSCMVNSFGLSATRKSWVEYTAELIGNGVWRASTVAKPSAVSESYLKAGDCSIFFGTSLAATPAQSKTAPGDITGTAYGAAIEVTSRVVSFNWQVNNNLPTDQNYGFNSGTTADHNDRGRRTQTLSMTLELHNSGQLSLLENQKTLALEFECFNELIESNAYYGFNLGFPRLIVESFAVNSATGDMVTVDYTFKVGEDTTKGSVLLDVYNTRSAYLG